MSVRIIAALSLVLGSAPAALAGPAADAVRYFYDNPGAELLEENRDRFTGAARAVLDANDRMWAESEDVCIDFGITVDAQDFDEDEIARTLALDERVAGDAAEVTARFSLFDEPRTIAWHLLQEGGAWKVADIAGLDGEGWRMSEFDCE